jgi:hypothetical protein
MVTTRSFQHSHQGELDASRFIRRVEAEQWNSGRRIAVRDLPRFGDTLTYVADDHFASLNGNKLQSDERCVAGLIRIAPHIRLCA